MNMKSVFLKPIGTLRDLGTARVWLGETVCLVILAAMVIAALFFL